MSEIPGLSQSEADRLAVILEPLRQGSRFFLFGSRSRGEHRAFSDVDTLVRGPEPIPFELLAVVESELEESSLPISVDLIDACRAPKEFLAAIESECRPL
jgi:Predicted nucleotidyltransferases